jgi:hypothetical protein
LSTCQCPRTRTDRAAVSAWSRIRLVIVVDDFLGGALPVQATGVADHAEDLDRGGEVDRRRRR